MIETSIMEVIARAYGPVGILLCAVAVLYWRLFKQIDELKEASFQKEMRSQAERITTLENTVKAAEKALIKLGAWRE